MNLRDEEILQNYFDRKMSPAQEQNFLIDVAARDDMRLAFRSNLELLKAVRADKDVASLAMVRSSTLAALGLGAGLLPNALKENAAAQAAAMPVSSGMKFWNVIRHPSAMLAAGLLAGSALTYSLTGTSTTASTGSNVSNPVTTKQQVIEIPTAPVMAPQPIEQTIEAPTASKQALKTVAHSAKSAVAKNTTTPATKESTELPVVQKSKTPSIQVQTSIHPAGENQK